MPSTFDPREEKSHPAGSEGSHWLEVSLLIDGEMAEAVAEVLARFAPGGVAIETTAIQDTPDGEGVPVGLLRVAAYLPVDENLEQERRRLEESLWFLGRIRPLPPHSFRLVDEVDWAEAWKEHYQPVPVGDRLIIVPAWLDPPTGDRVVLRMDPGMAFGTGTHPSTVLCLEVIEERSGRATPPKTVIDIGCGSGILAIASLLLGVDYAIGLDTDPQAVRIARENAELNGVKERLLTDTGSLERVLSGELTLRTADLVLANILAPVLVRLLDEGLAEVLAPGGELVLAGIIDTQEDEVLDAAARAGLSLVERRREQDWLALVMAAA